MVMFSITDLELATGGLLRLGDLPPRLGEQTPLGRIRHRLNEVLPGDVYWPLEPFGQTPNLLAEEAYSQGANGVVIAGRRLVPWAGCWSLQVAHPEQAWHDWQAWRARTQLEQASDELHLNQLRHDGSHRQTGPHRSGNNLDAIPPRIDYQPSTSPNQSTG